ncbi:MAG: hypothetical protein FWH49_00580 [Clostridiales bacterium]|nr:hypothetical protein [Clostridiales bacterium]
MDMEANWQRIKAHRLRLTDQEVRGLAEVLFYEQEAWLEEKLRQREGEALAMEILGFLGSIGSLQAVSILLKQLDSGIEVLQVAAVEALKQCPAIVILEPLSKIMLQQNRSSIKAGEVLLSFGENGAEELWNLWFDKKSAAGLKIQVLQLLAETTDARAVHLAFLAFLSEEDELILTAMKAAEKRNATCLWGNVAGCLSHSAWRIRGRAVHLLGEWKESRALDILREMGIDPDPWVEEERQKAIGILSHV